MTAVQTAELTASLMVGVTVAGTGKKWAVQSVACLAVMLVDWTERLWAAV